MLLWIFHCNRNTSVISICSIIAVVSWVFLTENVVFVLIVTKDSSLCINHCAERVHTDQSYFWGCRQRVRGLEQKIEIILSVNFVPRNIKEQYTFPWIFLVNWHLIVFSIAMISMQRWNFTCGNARILWQPSVSRRPEDGAINSTENSTQNPNEIYADR